MKIVDEIIGVSALNKIERPFKILLTYQYDTGHPPTFVIEYIDVYEYSYSWDSAKSAAMVNDGWGVIFAYSDREGTLYECLRRVKREMQGGES